MDSVLSINHAKEEKTGAYYGNIGRCLQLKGNLDDALIALKKSARILEKDDCSNADLNRGYARLWIGEILERQGNFKAAIDFLRAAFELWKGISPPRARAVWEKLKNIVARNPDLGAMTSDFYWEPEAQVAKWISEGN